MAGVDDATEFTAYVDEPSRASILRTPVFTGISHLPSPLSYARLRRPKKSYPLLSGQLALPPLSTATRRFVVASSSPHPELPRSVVPSSHPLTRKCVFGTRPQNVHVVRDARWRSRLIFL